MAMLNNQMVINYVPLYPLSKRWLKKSPNAKKLSHISHIWITSYPIYVITIPKLYYLILGKIITSPSYICLMSIRNKKLSHVITLPIYPIIRIHVQDIPIYNIL